MNLEKIEENCRKELNSLLQDCSLDAIIKIYSFDPSFIISITAEFSHEYKIELKYTPSVLAMYLDSVDQVIDDFIMKVSDHFKKYDQVQKNPCIANLTSPDKHIREITKRIYKNTSV